MNDQKQNTMSEKNYHNGNHAAIHEELVFQKKRDIVSVPATSPDEAIESNQGHWITINDGRHDYI